VLAPADLPPIATHALPVGDGHVLHVQEFGHAGGRPALLLHGGPGSGCSPALRRGFDAGCWRVVCVDQRGAGRSQPRGAIGHNTTPHLLADLRLVRHHLGIESWLVAGGSWGASLAIAHAADDPEAVSGLLLRASFLVRPEDIDWFFRGARSVRPTAWARFAAEVPGAEPTMLAAAFRSAPAQEQARLAAAWWRWEQALGTGRENLEPAADTIDTLVDRYRVQSHYLAHGAWLDAPPLLDRCARLPRVPTVLLHARDDAVCRPEGALALRARLPHARLVWQADGGHDLGHPSTQAAMRGAVAAFAGVQ
jgi:proline iminopeptidase